LRCVSRAPKSAPITKGWEKHGTSPVKHVVSIYILFVFGGFVQSGSAETKEMLQMMQQMGMGSGYVDPSQKGVRAWYSE
jgi:hypothetical protein